MKRALILVCAAVLAACGSGEQEDIRAWMDEQAKGMRGAVKALPEIKPFPIVEYAGIGADDPFRKGRMEVEKRANTALRPNLDRRKEPLEAYPLESLRMVGVLSQGKSVHALVLAGKNLHQVKVGNYMGQNFGVVTGISDGDMTLKELVEDVQGDWVERISTLTLQERQEAGR
ncbi:pilus assembly protein PilP [Thauera linaloolentis]|uniref:Pilus assembly protein PilP n=1 Tax=Thauera linaloolentis (strain DSM 12138 / JCM 21573 / CCUG 41526 / CIP 105981 / IAM 15112 / NBRC 102519 / 47Lol) TaxID=1123367 RepID=N6Z1M1_THAL4|nr:pilus assembly protein PilP [Thauera linaloolentis]ENO88487.1 pilus assembly protein PilP [Thauera linaloolentis 47Lol = DSM 12138]MCM8567449.1 pilus assembly protein PilP [Thauera linaloolentis]